MPKLHQDEPVLVVSAAGAVVSFVGTELVAHGVVAAKAWSSIEQTAVPPVAALFVLGLGVIARRLVTPWRKVAPILERDGLLTDADAARFEQLLTDKLAELGVTDEPDPGAEQTHDLGLIGDAPLPVSANAGAPQQ